MLIFTVYNDFITQFVFVNSYFIYKKINFSGGEFPSSADGTDILTFIIRVI